MRSTAIHGFRLNEKYLIGKLVPEQKPREMTSQNYNLIGNSTHVASNLIMRGIRNFTEKLRGVIDKFVSFFVGSFFKGGFTSFSVIIKSNLSLIGKNI